MFITREEYEEAKVSGNNKMIQDYIEQSLVMVQEAVEQFKECEFVDKHGHPLENNVYFRRLEKHIAVMDR